MDRLIQTQETNIIYGSFRGNDNEELFRCPRALMQDVARYINDHRALVAPMGSDSPFVDDDTEDLRNVAGRNMIGYFRMYYREGWAGRWFIEGDEKPSRIDCHGVQMIVDWLCERFPKGCNYAMTDYFANNTASWGGFNRHLLKPFMSDRYKVMIDTTYGNNDYPVRIYVYEKEA